MKLCALTFDDGPDTINTPKVLNKLSKHNIPATFFVIANKITNETEEVVKKIVNLGHEIENHSWDHINMLSLTAEQIRDSYEKANIKIEEYTGKRPNFFRPPNLSVNETIFNSIPVNFIGGVVAFDWEEANTSTQDRVDNVLNHMEDGSVILMHDSQPGYHPTPEALDIIIPELKRQGYKFVTVTELFNKRKGNFTRNEDALINKLN